MLTNRLPHQPLRRIYGGTGFSAYAQHRSDLIPHRVAITTEQNYRWCPMTGNVSPGSVNHMGQVHARKELLDQLLPKLALHERIGRDHTDIACTEAVL